mmetsp:Transcript_37283/g.112733  ORF Transcript_37283/g.112733 Transcript_37283/m.112733 type:complete len:209 (+) Transcript_37283:2924-3550(+)
MAAPPVMPGMRKRTVHSGSAYSSMSLRRQNASCGAVGMSRHLLSGGAGCFNHAPPPLTPTTPLGAKGDSVQSPPVQMSKRMYAICCASSGLCQTLMQRTTSMPCATSSAPAGSCDPIQYLMVSLQTVQSAPQDVSVDPSKARRKWSLKYNAPLEIGSPVVVSFKQRSSRYARISWIRHWLVKTSTLMARHMLYGTAGRRFHQPPPKSR